MRKAAKNTICILVILTLSISTALLTYLYFFASSDKNLSGEWTADLHMTEQAAVRALDWLQDIEAVSISLEDMETYMQDLNIRISLTLERSDRLGGTFSCQVSAESYDACNQAAYEAFAAAFRALLTERLRMAGYTESTDEEAVEALVTESFGMSTVSYLMNCGPALLPSLEELQERYGGSGVYEVSEGILIRRFDTGGAVAERTERYIRKGRELILLAETGSAHAGDFFEQYPLVYCAEEGEESNIRGENQ